MSRIARTVGGFALLIGGAFMLFLPGPGILTMLAGLGLLARDFQWARNLVDWGRSKLPQKDQDQLGG
jgi:Putative transmembrane protein (PGPGW)